MQFYMAPMEGITGYIYLRYFADKQSYIFQNLIIPKIKTLKETGKKLRG